MKFSIDKQEKYTLIKPEVEKLDTTVAPALKTEFINLNAEGTKHIILDLSEVKYVDSSGLSSILVGNRLCGNQNYALILTRLNDHVKKLITISQLDQVLNILPTIEESIEAIFMYEIENELNNEDESAI